MKIFITILAIALASNAYAGNIVNTTVTSAGKNIARVTRIPVAKDVTKSITDATIKQIDLGSIPTRNGIIKLGKGLDLQRGNVLYFEAESGIDQQLVLNVLKKYPSLNIRSQFADDISTAVAYSYDGKLIQIFVNNLSYRSANDIGNLYRMIAQEIKFESTKSVRAQFRRPSR